MTPISGQWKLSKPSSWSQWKEGIGQTIRQRSSSSEAAAGGIAQSCALRGLGLWPELSLPPRGGVSTSLGPSDPDCPAGVPGPQAPASAVQLNRERQSCLAPSRDGRCREGVACGSCGLGGSLLDLSSRVPGVTVSPSSMFPEGVPSQTTRNLQLEQETSNCSCQPWMSESVVTVKATGSVGHWQEHQPLGRDADSRAPRQAC